MRRPTGGQVPVVAAVAVVAGSVMHGPLLEGGRYPPAGPVRSGWALAVAGSSAGGFGAMRGLHALAAASTPV